MLIIIIGLPGSGKTHYYNEKYKDNYIFYDDFISNFFNGLLIKEIQRKKNICIADPRLCNYELFIKYMKCFEEILDKKEIKLILFKNDKEQCIFNANKRNNKNVNDTIINYNKIYNLDNYKVYNYEIIDVYKNNND